MNFSIFSALFEWFPKSSHFLWTFVESFWCYVTKFRVFDKELKVLDQKVHKKSPAALIICEKQGRRSAFEAQGVEKTSKNFAPAAHRSPATNYARQNSKKNSSLFLSFFSFTSFSSFFFFCFPFFPSFFSFPAHFKQKTSKIKVHGDKIWKKGKIAGKRPLIFSKPGSAGSRKITEPPSTPFLLPLRPWGPPTLL